jgi:DNA-binding MarR family transcriptional regulator
MTHLNSNAAAITNQIPSLGPVLDFLRLLWSFDHALHQSSKRMVSSLGITGPQRLVIRIVGRFPGITFGQLAEIMKVHPSTLTGIVKRLQNNRLISRRSDPRDGRRAFLGLTTTGRKLDLNREENLEAAVMQAMSELSGDQLEAAQQVLEKVTLALRAGT